MIKINLLPVRATKKKESVRQQLILFCIALVAFIGTAALVYSYELVKIGTTKDDIAKSDKELQRLKTVIGEIDNIKKLKDEVKKKLDILAQLRKEKTGPAIRLARLSEATPEKLWLTKYVENGGNVSISAIAFNEELIATFMRNLQGTGEFSNIELVVSEQVETGGTKAKRFDISCVLSQVKKEEPAPKPKK